MSNPIQRVMLEKKIGRVKKDLAEVEHEMQKASTEPVENPDDTFLVQNFSARKQKLEEQLAAYEK